MNREETICAPATSPVNSALSVIRVSGPDSLGVASALFNKSNNIKPRYSVYGQISDGDPIDDVVLVYYKGPASFTGEDSVEITCHGNPLIVQKIMNAFTKRGVRIAEPGEFSKRAFLNGKMDLTEAEAVNAIINARSEWEISTALKQMHGSLKNEISAIRFTLTEIKADVECGIDFTDEEDVKFISSDEGAKRMGAIESDLQNLYRRCKLGEKISHGIDLPIAGKPNVGKSSILNLILNTERAIVSDIPGTTRDLIKETIQFAGFHVNLIDTAGIREADNEIERIGISLSRKKIDEAPLVIMVFDLMRGIDDEDRAILESLREKRVIYLGNKCDMTDSVSEIEREFGIKIIPFSARTGVGMKDLEAEISGILSREYVECSDSFLADVRILDLLSKGIERAANVKMLFQNSEPEEIVAFELHGVIDSLSEITGEISPDDVLGSIFSRFCVGK